MKILNDRARLCSSNGWRGRSVFGSPRGFNPSTSGASSKRGAPRPHLTSSTIAHGHLVNSVAFKLAIVTIGVALFPLFFLCFPASTHGAELAKGAELPKQGPTAESNGGMIVSVSRDASEAGRRILDSGGNAVDAAVAVAFALQVTWPEAGNIGGGGFMLVHSPNLKEPVVIDYRERAPAAATVDMFAKGDASQYRMVGVPGTVRGLKLAHQRFGKLP